MASNFNVKPVQKFGTQTEKGKIIYVWRNGDKNQGKGVRMVIHPTKVRTFEQLKDEMSKKMGNVTGPVIKVYNQNQKLVKNLEDFEDGGKYIAAGAEKLIRDAIPVGFSVEDPENVSEFAALRVTEDSTDDQPSVEVTRKPVVSSYAQGAPTKFGTQTEKGKIIYVFRNGDKNQGQGIRLLIHPTKVKTFDQLKNEMSKKVGNVTGPVLKVYGPDQKQVRNLEDFVDGSKYIAAGAEKLDFNAIPYGFLSDDAEGASEGAAVINEASPSQDSFGRDSDVKERKPVVSVYSQGGPSKFGTQTEKGKIIYVFRNGDKNQGQGVRLIIHPTKVKTFDQLKNEMSKKVGNVTGPVLKVYGPDQKLVRNLEDFEDGTKYIAAGAEKFDVNAIPVGFLSEDPEGVPELAARRDRNADDSFADDVADDTRERKPVVSVYSAGGPSKFGTQTEKGKIINVFRNGDKNQGKGIRMVIHPTKVKTFDQLKTEMSKKLGLVTGPVLKVYGQDQKQVRSLDAFADGAKYIAAGAERLDTSAIPLGFLADDPEGVDELAAVREREAEVDASFDDDAPDQEVKERKPVVAGYAQGGPNKFGTQTEKGKIIYVFRNGDKNQGKAVRLVIHPTKVKTFDQLKNEMSKKMGNVTGPVLKVYGPDQKLVKTLEDFEDGCKYIAAGAEKLSKDAIPVGFLADDPEGVEELAALR